jgi:hypothetical protein
MRVGEDIDARPEIAAGNLGRQSGEYEQRMKDRVRGAGRVVVGGEDPVEPTLMSGAGHAAGEFERSSGFHVARVDRPDVDAELHDSRSRRSAMSAWFK